MSPENHYLFDDESLICGQIGYSFIEFKNSDILPQGQAHWQRNDRLFDDLSLPLAN
jgi:hypothetical protein